MCKLSIIIPTFNRAHLIGETIQAFINQSYSNWEIIVVDDGATDDTPDFINSYKDSRINYYKRNKKHKKGPSGCRNYGLSVAKGKFVLFFDDDDIAHPDLLQICMEEFISKDIHFCRYEREVFYRKFNKTFNRERKYSSFEIDTDDLEKMITNKLPFNTCAIVWKKSCFGPERFNEDLFYSDEWEFYQRILSRESIKGININKVLLFARKHENSSTGNFLKANTKYLESTRKAMKLGIRNLFLKERITPTIKKFFVRKAFELKDKTILLEILYKTNSGFLTTSKYVIGFHFYPVVRPFLILKGKLKS